NEVHHEVQVFVRLPENDRRDDIAVVQGCGEARLLHERTARGVVERRMQHFNRHEALEPVRGRKLRGVDLAHSPGADSKEQPMAAERARKLADPRVQAGSRFDRERGDRLTLRCHRLRLGAPHRGYYTSTQMRRVFGGWLRALLAIPFL